jgi:hypothetical protein
MLSWDNFTIIFSCIFTINVLSPITFWLTLIFFYVSVQLAQDRDQLWAAVNMIISHWVP